MTLKDSIFSWFLKNVVLSKAEIIDKPGFIITSVSDKKKETYLRDLFLEEQLFSMIEKKIVEVYDTDGKKALYSSGKKFGYIYANLSNFTRLTDNNKKNFLDFCYFLVNYITTIYARKANYDVDLSKKRFSIELDDYVICNENGLGYLMTAGGIGGIWSYMLNDKTIEAVQETCQGRNDDLCRVVAQPYSEFANTELSPFIETNISEMPFTSKYKQLNLIRETKLARTSLKNLLNSKTFSYKNGSLQYKNIRYFHCESNMPYLLEKEISKLPNGSETLFDICYDYGVFLQKQYGGRDYKKFIMDYFSALGWGEVITILKEGKPTVTAVYYPWTNFSVDSKYIIFRGVLSGFISKCINKELKFNRYDSNVTNYLTVNIYESN